MAEETSDANTMNLDLILGPDTEPLSGAVVDEAIVLDDSIDEPFNRTSDHHHHHHGHDHDNLHEINRMQQAPQYPYLWPHSRDTISLELDELLENSGNGSVLQAGEGSVAAEERAAEVPKACEIGNGGVALDETSEKKKEDVEKAGGGGDRGFFDCNICFDMAKDPVVTCCGHLFCWPCLYKWLHLQSHTKKGCPVCKGEVNVKSVTPIYGCGNNAQVHEEEDTNLKIPLRPSARCVSEDSTARPTGQRNVLYTPAEERIRNWNLRSRHHLSPGFVERGRRHEHANAPLTPERTSAWWSESRGARTAHNLRGEPQDGAVSSTQNNLDVPLAAGNRPVRVRTFFNTATLRYAVREVEPNFGSNPIGRNREQVDTAHNLWLRRFN